MSNSADELATALRRIANGHKKSPQYPNGHIWSADCDFCNANKVAQEALAKYDAQPSQEREMRAKTIEELSLRWTTYRDISMAYGISQEERMSLRYRAGGILEAINLLDDLAKEPTTQDKP